MNYEVVAHLWLLGFVERDIGLVLLKQLLVRPLSCTDRAGRSTIPQSYHPALPPRLLRAGLEALGVEWLVALVLPIVWNVSVAVEVKGVPSGIVKRVLDALRSFHILPPQIYQWEILSNTNIPTRKRTNIAASVSLLKSLIILCSTVCGSSPQVPHPRRSWQLPPACSLDQTPSSYLHGALPASLHPGRWSTGCLLFSRSCVAPIL